MKEGKPKTLKIESKVGKKIKHIRDIMKKNAKYIIIILFIIIFLTPIIGVMIYDFLGYSIGSLYTFNLELKDFYTFWITFFGAFAIGYGIIQTHDRINQQEKVIKNDRFAKGVELLENKNMSVRIGGIYYLYNLVEDYPKEYSKTVFSIFCGHIKTTAARTPKAQVRYVNNKIDLGDANDVNSKGSSPTEEIQILLDLMFTKRKRRKLFKGLHANLQNSNLSGTNLRNANLINANLNNTLLKNTNLHGANLERASFYEAYLKGTNLEKTNLRYTNFTQATIDGVWFKDANVEGAYFVTHKITGDDLSKAKNLDKAAHLPEHFRPKQSVKHPQPTSKSKKSNVFRTLKSLFDRIIKYNK